MKIAGNKNGGAWVRANKLIRTLTETEMGNLAAYLQEACPSKDNAYNAILSLATEAGVEPPASPSTSGAWVSRLVTDGIPHQVWMGRLSFTTYTKVAGKYVANHQSAFHEFGKELRKAIKLWIHGRRAVKDLMDAGAADEGNPGGNPDGSRPA